MKLLFLLVTTAVLMVSFPAHAVNPRCIIDLSQVSPKSENKTTDLAATDVGRRLFLSDSWFKGRESFAFPKALAAGEIKFIVNSHYFPEDLIAFDFEVALRVWLKALGISGVKITRIESTDARSWFLKEAAVSVEYGQFVDKTVDAKLRLTGDLDSNDDYFSILYIAVEGRNLKSDKPKIPWMSLQQALTVNASSQLKTKHGPFEPLRTFFGPAKTAEEMASQIVAMQPRMYWATRPLLVNKKNYGFLYATLVRELGHLFGLAQIDILPGETMALPKGVFSVMAPSKSWVPLYPTSFDVTLVKNHISHSIFRAGQLSEVKANEADVQKALKGLK